MKTRFFTILFSIFITHFAISQQVAVNFNVASCNGNRYNLFELLDEGKVVVLCWVMPCSSCVPASKTAYNVANSFATSNPGQVMFFLCDDTGLSPCASITNFATNNRLSNAISFSTSSIAMSDYGNPGMPKIVVVGGSDHLVYDVQNLNFGEQTEVNIEQLLAAINTAIANSNATKNVNLKDDGIVIFPNPASTELNIENLNAECQNAQIFDISGKLIKNLDLILPESRKKINIADLKSGVYFLKIKNNTINFIKN
jgi:hypothetical protein